MHAILNTYKSKESGFIRFRFIFILFSFLLLQDALAQNKTCSFDFKTYYFASSIGTDPNSEKQAIKFLLKTIFGDFKSRFDQPTFNRILTRCNIIKTCQPGNNQVTAYVLRSSCRNCFTCQPNTAVNFSNIPDNSSKLKIQLNASDFFNELYCAYDQNASLKTTKFMANNRTLNIIAKIWELNKFRCPDLNISKTAIERGDGYRIEHIPVVLGNHEDLNEEISLAFDKNGILIDFSFMTTTHTNSNKLDQNFITSVNIFLENFRTACITKDSSFIMKLLLGDNPPTLTESQREYLLIIKKSFKERGFTNYSFDDIELCPIINDQTIFGVSIYQKYNRESKTSILGYLTLVLEMQNQKNSFTINSFKASKDKLDPCFP